MTTIVHVVEAAATGTLTMVCTSANAFASAGHDVHVVYSARPETPPDLARMFQPEVTLHLLPMNGKSSLAAIPQLRRLLSRLDPGVVHLHSSFAGFLGRAATIGTLRGARLFYSPHCISMMRTDIGLRRYLFAALERLASIRKCTYLACSESERSAIREWLGVEPVLIENSVEFALPEMAAAASQDKLKSVICVGGVRLQKNPWLFAEISRECRRRGVPCSFSWVGDGDKALVNLLRESGVTVTGWKSKSEVGAMLADSHIYLSTSSWEGMPVSVIEAMACGIPVVASRSAGNVDVIEHGHTGLLFDGVHEAVELVEALSTGRTDTPKLVRNALRDARNRFSVQRHVEKLGAAYFS